MLVVLPPPRRPQAPGLALRLQRRHLPADRLGVFLAAPGFARASGAGAVTRELCFECCGRRWLRVTAAGMDRVFLCPRCLATGYEREPQR